MRKTLAALSRLLRHGLPALAVYALVLQAFLTGAAPAANFHPEHAPLCAEISTSSPAPAQQQSHPDCICLAQCLQAHAGIGIFPEAADLAFARDANFVLHAPINDETYDLHPLQRGPGARAPPMI